jgi:sensor histidine kinase regulating citrate/malate metabolism
MSRVYDALIQGAKKSHSRSTVLESGTDQKTGLLGLSSRDIGLEWKITGTVATVIFIFGMLLIITAHQFIGRALRTEIDQRTLAITTNLSNAAVGHVMSKNIIELYALLTKYARLNGVAYAFIEDSNGQIVGHSIRPFPRLVTTPPTSDEGKQVSTRVVTLQEKPVYETSVPILEGQLGTAHLGMWAEGVNMEINNARTPFFGLIILVLLVAVVVSSFLARAMIARSASLANLAGQLSAGERSTAVEN